MTGRSFEQRCNDYAKSVVKEETPAGKFVRLACQRHLDDLKKKDSPYKFNPELDYDGKKQRPVERICKFAERMPHVKGKWAAKKEKIKLEDWQVFLLGVLFGWVSKKTGLRRFRKAMWLIPRKNGKSVIAAVVGSYMFVMDREFGSEVYSGATSEDQAWEVFRPAKQMIERSPGFADSFGIEVNAKSLYRLSDGSRFRPVIGKPGDGASPSCAIHDEYHEHQTDEQVDTMETGMAAREQPLQLIVTTAGSDTSSPCYSACINGRKVLEGVHEQEDLFYIEYSIDPEDSWLTEDALRKANPNYGVSVFPELLLSRLEAAKNDPHKQSTFQTKHLNVWVGAANAYFNVQKWRDNKRDITLSDYEGMQCIAGLDLASKIDIASKVLLFPPVEKGEKWAVFHTGYLPEETVYTTSNEHYQTWAREGWLEVTDGEITDYELIRDDILDDCKTFEVLDVAYDPHQATMLVNELMRERVPVIEFRPTVLNFSEPMKFIDALIRSGDLIHNGDPVLEWMISNVTAKEDRKDNVYPRKEKAENKIDGVVALIMAAGRGMVMREEKRTSVYEQGVI